MSDDPVVPSPRLRLPSALLKIWGGDTQAAGNSEAGRTAEGFLSRHEGVHKIAKNLFAISPLAGDEAVFDAAMTWSEALRREPGVISGGLQARGLIVPCVLLLSDDGTAELEPDPITTDLATEEPDLEPGTYMSARAVQTLEYAVTTQLSGPYNTVSGSSLPLIQVTNPRYDKPPWRNREVLGQQSHWVERQGTAGVSAGLEEAVLRVTGGGGVGKTRMVWELLQKLRRQRLWLTVRSHRLRTPILAEQALRQILLPSAPQENDPLHPGLEAELDRLQIQQALENRRGRGGEGESRLLGDRAVVALEHLVSANREPIWLVIDDCHRLGDFDSDFLARVHDSPKLSKALRLVLIGRTAINWDDRFSSTPEMPISVLDEQETRKLAEQLTVGFALPEELLTRLLAEVGGNPFVLEEGLFALVHDKSLRRVYGSFFFAGNPEREFAPSQRFVRHIEAEVGRLSDLWPVRLLSLLDEAAPEAELASASSLIGHDTTPGWAAPLVDAGILVAAESPWGHGVTIATIAQREALEQTLSEADRDPLKQHVGELLAGSGEGGEAHWRSYQLLAGSAEATEPLLKLVRSSYATKLPQRELLDALTSELRRHHASGGDPAIELELLWRLLPLARRQGLLRNYEDELTRGVELGKSDPLRLLALASIKAEMEQESGRLEVAEGTIKKALEAAASAEPKRKALLLIQLGRLLQRQQRLGEAQELFLNVREAVGQEGSSPLTATCDFYLGNVALRQGRHEDAEQAHKAALKERRRHDLPGPTGASLSALGAVAIGRGHYPAALEYYREAQQLLEEHGKAADASYALIGVAKALNRMGDHTGATGPVRKALELRQDRGDSAGVAIAQLAVARNYFDIGRPDTALELARKAHFQLSMLSAEGHLADAEALIGRVHLSRRRYDRAKTRCTTAADLHRSEGDLEGAALDVSGLLEIALAEGDNESVRRHTTELKNLLNDLPPSDVGDLLAYRLYQGLEHLTAAGLKVGDPLTYLSKAYKGVLQKAEHLSHEQRQRYLFQLRNNQEIVAEATEKGLTGA
ncbi:MAG: tetratricopeptide repeat protein [Acidobacteriota bacterium]|nr:tetratricopeptide repeat protein [Acidobacteriota bacterium]